jgi:trimeric autotransporter adhesin
MTTIVRRPLRTTALVSLLLGTGLASPVAFAQQRVGVDSAVNPAAMGIPPGGLPRRLVLGQDVVFNERITTEAQGQTQILFVDESTMSVGPNANMVIDRFVYDPNSGTGKLAASLTRGIFRFVGGKLSKQDNAVTMRTPTATIGIRGGVMLVNLRPDCAAGPSYLGATGCNALEVIFVYGKGVTVTGLNGVSQTITRPGFEVTVSGPGASPSAPSPAPPGATAALVAQLDGRAGGNGGAPTVPTEVMVTSSGFTAVSNTITASIQAAAHLQPPAPQPPTISPAVQLAQLNNPIVAVQGATVTPVNGGPSVPFAQLLTNPTPIGTPVPTSTPLGIPVPSSPPPATPIVGPSVPPIPTPPIIIPPVVTVPVVTPPVVTPPVVTPPVNIAGAAGNLVLNGSLTPYTAGSVTNGIFSATTASGPISYPLKAGSTYVSSDNTFFYASLLTSPSAQSAFVYGGQAVNQAFYQATATSPKVLAFSVQPDAALQSNIPFIRQQTGGTLSGAGPLILETPANSVFSTDTGSTKALQASLATNGTGAGQSSAIVVLVGNVFGTPALLEGVVHGSYLATATGQPARINTYYATPADGNGNGFYGANGISGFALSPGAGAASAVETNTLNQTTTASYQFAQPAVPTPAPAPATAPTNSFGTAQNLTGWFGGIMTKEPNGGVGSPIAYMLAGQTAISTYPSDLHITAALTGGDPATSSTSGIPAANGMVLQFGSTDGTNARQAYINNNLFGVLESPSTASTVAGVSVPYSASFPNTNPNIYLVTQTAAGAPTSLLPNGLCNACQYLQWGYWGGEIDTPASGESPARVDVGHINSWVAGIPTSAGDISSLKAASFNGSYTGNLFGTVFNNGAQYLASGGLTAAYNFGTGNGSFAVKNYDGLSFTATGNSALSGSNYTFGIKNVPGVAGTVSGTFYGPMATETGGNFAFGKTVGSPYFTSGIFAAKQ